MTKQGLSKSRADLDRLFVLRPFRVEQIEVGVSWNDGQPLGAVHALDQAPTTRTSNARARPVSTRANLLRRYSSVGLPHLLDERPRSQSSLALLAAELTNASRVTLHIRTPAHRPSPAPTAREESRQQETRYQHRSSDHGDSDNSGALVGVVSPTADVLGYQHERVEHPEHGPFYPGSHGLTQVLPAARRAPQDPFRPRRSKRTTRVKGSDP